MGSDDLGKRERGGRDAGKFVPAREANEHRCYLDAHGLDERRENGK